MDINFALFPYTQIALKASIHNTKEVLQVPEVLNVNHQDAIERQKY